MATSAAPQDVPYTSHAFVQTHPRRLSTVAWLMGLDAPPLATCRVLELGCAAGGNLLPMAIELPDAQFVGVDVSATSVQKGRQAIAELHLTNVSIEQHDIADWQYAGPPFDYILAHGVYSWVPPLVQRRILEICAQHLAPNGVAYLSYNTQPGWSLRGVVRDYLRFAVDASQPPSQRVHDARQLLELLGAAFPAGRAPQAPLVQHELQRLANQTDDYLFHEYLTAENEPLYFRDFAASLRPHGLRYLGEAEYSWMSSADLPPEVAQSLRTRARTREELEQFLDFVRWQLFRQTLVCRDVHEPVWTTPPERMYDLQLAGELTMEGRISPLGSNEVVTFSRPKSRMSTPQPLAKAALATLAQSWPRWWKFGDLLRESLSRLGVPTAPSTPVEQLPHARELAETLRRAYGVALVEAARTPPPVADSIAARPVAALWARRQAQRTAIVPNAAHASHTLQGFQRFVLTQLDGGRDREALLDIIEREARDSVSLTDSQGGTVTDRLRVREVLGETLDRTLQELLQLGFLLADPMDDS
ncbi:MAG: class I SAM-dependent methyltransferase [Pirellulales bacterium]